MENGRKRGLNTVIILNKQIRVDITVITKKYKN